ANSEALHVHKGRSGSGNRVQRSLYTDFVHSRCLLSAFEKTRDQAPNPGFPFVDEIRSHERNMSIIAPASLRTRKLSSGPGQRTKALPQRKSSRGGVNTWTSSASSMISMLCSMFAGMA